MSATKPVQEPPHASEWKAVRDACIGYSGDEWCGYPFCRCEPPLSTITNDGGGVTTALRASVPISRCN